MTAATKPTKRPRDVRLDFFRGVCLVIIYIAHIWDNPWASFIPARFGFSDATEIFVFCSGMASAVAFGSIFAKRGFWIGAARIAHRCWQVYWCHIALFLTITAFLAGIDRWLDTRGAYINGLGLSAAFNEHAPEMIFGLLTLNFVPNFFDILPMYLVILAMMPFVVALAQRDLRLTAMALIVLWAIAGSGALDLPAEPWSNAATKTWFFNPFGWQLIFFTGFAFMMGWLPPPPVNGTLLAAALAVIVISMPLTWWPGIEASETLQAWHNAVAPFANKTRFGILRYVHFLALAYVAYIMAGEKGANLSGPLVEILRRLGQQSLAIFMTGLSLSFVASVLLNFTGRSALAVAVINLGGLGVLVVVARAVTWFKSSPWAGDKKAEPRPARPIAAESASENLAPAE